MRRTVFVVPAGLAGVVQAACTDDVARRMRRQLEKDLAGGGVGDGDAGAWLRSLEDGVLRALAARGGGATGAQLSADEPRLRTQLVYAPDKSYGGAANITSRVLVLIAAEGRTIRGHRRAATSGSVIELFALVAEDLPGATQALLTGDNEVAQGAGRARAGHRRALPGDRGPGQPADPAAGARRHRPALPAFRAADRARTRALPRPRRADRPPGQPHSRRRPLAAHPGAGRANGGPGIRHVAPGRGLLVPARPLGGGWRWRNATTRWTSCTPA